MVRPAVAELVVAKKPLIECRFAVPFDAESLYVEIDRMDVTAFADIEEGGFVYRPMQVLPPGEHTLYIAFLTDSGREVAEEFRFATRHTKPFETFSSSNTVTGTYTRILAEDRDNVAVDQSDWEVHGNLESRNDLSEGPWSVNLRGNARYQDRELPYLEPQDSGVELINYLLEGRYQKGRFFSNLALGDVVIDETRNTVSYLSRRGGQLTAEYGSSRLSGFIVRSDQVYGLDRKSGLEPDTDDHLLGVSGGVGLFDNRLEIKTVYATGGRELEESSFGIWPPSEGIKGRVLGIRATSNFFQDRLRTTIEVDRSEYDGDTSDGTDYETDEALFVELGGQVSRFDYRAVYEYTGPEYDVPLNPGIQSDWEGFDLSSGLYFAEHTFRGSYSQYNDNVEGRSAYARTYNHELGLTYKMTMIPSLPVNLSWSRCIQDSSDEPSGVNETKSYKDVFKGDITYMSGPASVTLDAEYSQDDDRTELDYDTSAVSLGLSSTYSGESLYLYPSIRFNRDTDEVVDVDTDTYTYSLNFEADIVEGLSIDGDGSFTRTTTSDDSIDQDLLNANLRLSYGLSRPLWNIFSPELALTVSHDESIDNNADTEDRDTVLTLSLSGTLDLSF